MWSARSRHLLPLLLTALIGCEHRSAPPSERSPGTESARPSDTPAAALDKRPTVRLAPPEAAHLEYAGRYSSGPFALFTVEAVEERLAIVPPFWTSKPYLRHNEPDEFYMVVPHIDLARSVRFVRDDGGSVVALEAIGFENDGARFERLEANEVLPIELLLRGRIDEAIAKVDASGGIDSERWTEIATNLVVRYPTKTREAIALLARLSDRLPDDAQRTAIHGYALLADDRREEATAAFETAARLDPENELAVGALRRIQMSEPPPEAGYRALFPYDLAALFAPPTDAEIASVRADWERRDLRPREVETVASETLALEHCRYDARIVRHLVHGDEHYGAIVVPQRAEAGSLAVVVEARGVNPEYTPRELSDGTQLMRALGELQCRFLFVIPSFRGETIELHGLSFTSSGDRADSWDGATDDALALLNVALDVEPAADAGRIAAYGKSRGGSVALLAALRDERIGLALNLAGPTDWFRGMENRFWSTHEILRDMLREGNELVPTQEGGQFYERFIAPVAHGEWSLAEARLSMLAGSPLYFAESLPASHSYYGAEDRSVPILNAQLLEARMRDLGRPATDFRLTVYPERGHDTEPFLAYRSMVAELGALLSAAPPRP